MAGVDAVWDGFASTRDSGVAVFAGINRQRGVSVPPTRNGRSLFCPRVRGLTTVCIIITLVCAVFVFFRNGIHLSCLLRPVSVWDLRVEDIALHHCRHSPGATVTQRNFICDWFLGKVTIAPGTRYLPLPRPFQEGNKKTENCFCTAFMCCTFRQTRSNYACVAPIQNVRRLQLFVRWIMNFYA